GAYEAPLLAKPLGELARLAERGPREPALARLHPRFAEQQEQLASAALVLGREPGGDVERPGVVLGRLLVVQQRRRLIGGRARVGDRLLGLPGAGGPREVMGQRAGRCLAGSLERLADAAV